MMGHYDLSYTGKKTKKCGERDTYMQRKTTNDSVWRDLLGWLHTGGKAKTRQDRRQLMGKKKV